MSNILGQPVSVPSNYVQNVTCHSVLFSCRSIVVQVFLLFLTELPLHCPALSLSLIEKFRIFLKCACLHFFANGIASELGRLSIVFLFVSLVCIRLQSEYSHNQFLGMFTRMKLRFKSCIC